MQKLKGQIPLYNQGQGEGGGQLSTDNTLTQPWKVKPSL